MSGNNYKFKVKWEMVDNETPQTTNRHRDWNRTVFSFYFRRRLTFFNVIYINIFASCFLWIKRVSFVYALCVCSYIAIFSWSVWFFFVKSSGTIILHLCEKYELCYIILYWLVVEFQVKNEWAQRFCHYAKQKGKRERESANLCNVVR